MHYIVIFFVAIASLFLLATAYDSRMVRECVKHHSIATCYEALD